MAQYTRKPATGAALAARLPEYSPTLEVQLLGAALHEWAPPPDPALFYVPGHAELAGLIGALVAELGAVSGELVLARAPGFGALVVECEAEACGRSRVAAVAKELGNLALRRIEAEVGFAAYLELTAAPPEAKELAPVTPLRPERKAAPGLGFTPVVHASFQNGAVQLIDLEIQPEPGVEGTRHLVRRSELRKADEWDRYPEAVGISSRGRRDDATDRVVELALAKVVHIHAPGWYDGRFVVPPVEYCSDDALAALDGYGHRGKGGEAAWAQIAAEMPLAPRLALFTAAPVAGLFLPLAGLEDELDPLGFLVHAVGDGRLGKTTALRLAAAELGDPAKVVRSWWASGPGLSVYTRELGQLPLVLDDTSTWARPLAELPPTVMRTFGGVHTVSTRDAATELRGSVYRSVALSTGNESITAAASADCSTAILGRVLELDAPLTASAAQAHKLKRLAREGAGWPLEILGSSPGLLDVFTHWLDFGRQLVPQGERDPVIGYNALQCAVLVGAGGALGSLVGAAESWATAALAGAVELLDQRRAARYETARPAWRALLEAVWVAYHRRPDLFPEPERDAPNASIDGYRLPPEGKLPGRVAVFPVALRRIAAEAGIREPSTAIRTAAAEGVLYPEGAHRYTSRLYRREGATPWRSPAMYVFGPEPEDLLTEDPPLTPTPPDPRGSPGPRADHADHPTPAELPDPRDPRDPRALTREGTNEIRAETALARPDRAAVLALGPEGIASTSGRPLVPVVLGLDDEWHLGELADGALANGATAVWLTTPALAWLGLPPALPAAEAGAGLPDRAVDRATAAGWHVVKPGRVPGLSPLMVLARGDGPKVEIHVPVWQDWRGSAAATLRGSWPGLAELGTAAELAANVRALQGALSPDKPWRLDTSHLSTFRHLAAVLQPDHPPRALGHELEPMHEPELPDWLARDVPRDGYAVMFDRNRAFLAALGTVGLSLCGPVISAPVSDELFDARQQGRVLCAPAGDGPEVALFGGGSTAARWLPTSLLRLAGPSFGIGVQLNARRAYTSKGTDRWFRPLCDRVRKGLEQLDGHPAAAAELKRIYSKGIANLSTRYEDAPEWFRPDWKAEILGEHVANTWRAVAKAEAAGACLIGTGARDAALFVVPELGTVPAELRVGPGTGAWKPRGKPLLASYVASMAERGASFLDVMNECGRG